MKIVSLFRWFVVIDEVELSFGRHVSLCIDIRRFPFGGDKKLLFRIFKVERRARDDC